MRGIACARPSAIGTDQDQRWCAPSGQLASQVRRAALPRTPDPSGPLTSRLGGQLARHGDHVAAVGLLLARRELACGSGRSIQPVGDGVKVVVEQAGVQSRDMAALACPSTGRLIR